MTDKELTKTLSPAPCAFALEQFLKEYREKRSLQVWQRTEPD
ncbi:hypothetical protein [Escherichia coli]|nr:hypothetical protein [Escherichia coli]